MWIIDILVLYGKYSMHCRFVPPKESIISINDTCIVKRNKVMFSLLAYCTLKVTIIIILHNLVTKVSRYPQLCVQVSYAVSAIYRCCALRVTVVVLQIMPSNTTRVTLLTNVMHYLSNEVTVMSLMLYIN